VKKKHEETRFHARNHVYTKTKTKKEVIGGRKERRNMIGY
jgi:hypothetical protein